MKVEEIKTINIDGTAYEVSGLSTQTQQLVELYNDWRVKAADARSTSLAWEASLRDLSREIIEAVKKDITPADEEVTSDTTTTEVPVAEETAA
jgi:hypothetical protein